MNKRPPCFRVKKREKMLFENKKQEVYTVNMHQIDLNRDVDNRRLQVDGIITLAWGYSA